MEWLKKWYNWLLIIAIYLIYRKMQNEQFIKKFINHIIKWEGGTSDSPDSSASKGGFCPGTKIHTSKGVTWGAYKSYCNKNGITPNAKKFLEMPYDLWYKVFKTMFFDYWNFDVLSELNFKLCCFIVEVSWMSSPKGAEKFFANYLRSKGFKDSDITPREIPNYFSELILSGQFDFDDLINARKAQMKTFKTYSKNGKGWDNRTEAFRKL